MRRDTCLELRRLPKITGPLKSINFRRTTPGSITRIIYGNRPPPPSLVLDPTHPSLHYNRPSWGKTFPWRTYPGFAIRAVPKAVLAPPTTVHPDPPHTLNEGPLKGRSANMSLLDCEAKSVGGRVTRQVILRKFKTAISLIVVRGADVEGQGDEAKLVFREEHAGKAKDWILSDWTYIVRPKIEVYGMPYTEFIPTLRRALRDIVTDGRRLELEWAKLADKQRHQSFARPAHATSQPEHETLDAMQQESGSSSSRDRPPHLLTSDRTSS
ncbi:hypothetical protein C8Q70DRAFT_272267 [Cubamyces menziesii]|uniref:Uncharacterized protein n=1 Tax=Trametes cubensis TaxID=1111947 RepID=A0AAD7TIJ6_9APHY|nr:hypothetical protein C8Q70DRAFT_272267 [Cubamyces menziesii]KAJ8462436.1 hypothetical protein ONZ51_g10907 [Trametes cubensis]